MREGLGMALARVSALSGEPGSEEPAQPQHRGLSFCVPFTLLSTCLDCRCTCRLEMMQWKSYLISWRTPHEPSTAQAYNSISSHLSKTWAQVQQPLLHTGV